jgi:hypothetical protein
LEGVLCSIVRFESLSTMYRADQRRSDICEYIISNSCILKPPRMHGLLNVILRHTLWIPCGEEHIEQLLSIAFRVLGELQKKPSAMKRTRNLRRRASGLHIRTIISTLDRRAGCKLSVSTYEQVKFPASSHSTTSKPGEAMVRARV